MAVIKTRYLDISYMYELFNSFKKVSWNFCCIPRVHNLLSLKQVRAQQLVFATLFSETTC